jgi:FlaA1/EpsC-like NDP-sugar epimerase
MRDENSIKPEKLFVLANTRIFFKQNKSIIITGGLGGFGLELIQFFADRGAKNIVFDFLYLKFC